MEEGLSLTSQAAWARLASTFKTPGEDGDIYAFSPADGLAISHTGEDLNRCSIDAGEMRAICAEEGMGAIMDTVDYDCQDWCRLGQDPEGLDRIRQEALSGKGLWLINPTAEELVKACDEALLEKAFPEGAR